MTRRAFLLLTSLALSAGLRAEIVPTPSGAPVDTAELANGDLLVEANTSMKLPRGISSRASWFVATPLEKVKNVLPGWNPQPHGELEVQQFRSFAPDTDPGFESLRFDERSAPVRKLLAAMRDRDGLQLSPAELAQLPATINAESAREFWVDVLRARWVTFLAAGLRVPATGAFDARSEIRTLLREEPRVTAHFAALLATTPVETDSPGIPVRCYWQHKVINGVAGLTLGVIYRRDHQFVDFEFYVSSGYYVACTVYEVRPLELGGRSGTFIWQENFASSPLLTGAFGLKRKLATMAIEADAKRSIRAFRKDLLK